MYLAKLEIQGFKSFAEKTVLEFNHELTAIVGPNGSGKSNVSDAIRWVLGEQSLKTLRGKKAEDVIFSGTNLKPRMGFAEVSLTLDNSEESSARSAIDYREVVITRRIYRNGESEYLLNKNKVRLLDIQLLLAKASFGQRNYSIIGQGMIDAILMASPLERKEFFDEATGVRTFQLKRGQAMSKLESSSENLKQSEQLIAEIEPRLKSLTRQVKRLEKKDEIETELKTWQERYYSRLEWDLEQKIEELKKSFNIIEKAKQETASFIETEQKKIDAEQFLDTAADAFQKLQREYNALSEEKNQLNRKLSLLKSQLELNLVQAGKMDVVWINNRLEELNRKLAGIVLTEKDDLKEQARLEQILSGRKKENEELNLELNALQAELQNYSQKLLPQDKISSQKIGQKLNDLYLKQKDLLAILEQPKENFNFEKIKNLVRNILTELKELAEMVQENQPAEEINRFNSLQEQLNKLLAKKEKLAEELNELKIRQELFKQQNDQSLIKQNELLEERTRLEKELKAFSGQSADPENDFKKDARQLEDKIKAAEEKQNELTRQLEHFSGEQKKQKEGFIKLQQNLRQTQDKYQNQETELNGLKIELARWETKKENLEQEIAAEMKNGFTPLALTETINTILAQAEIQRLKNQLAIIGAIDEESVKEYEEVRERYTFLNEQIIDLNQAIESCRKIIEELDVKINEQFETAFEKINGKFQDYFKVLFNGGQAKLTLKKKLIEIPGGSETETPIGTASEEKPSGNGFASGGKYEIGIEIEATPPGKRLKNLNVLSGGEKALISIALISAIMANNPSPFVVLDEVDAALDEANSERFAKIIKELSDKTQFICITHNRATMQQAAILYGVTMGADGVSKLLSVNLSEAEKTAQN